MLLNHRLNRVAGPAADQRVRFLLAAFCADRRFAPALASRENSADDSAEALTLVDETRLERLLHETEIVIATHWSAVEAVAQALLERNSLPRCQKPIGSESG